MAKDTEKEDTQSRSSRRRIPISAADTAMAIARAMATTRALSRIRVTPANGAMAKTPALKISRALARTHARELIRALVKLRRVRATSSAQNRVPPASVPSSSRQQAIVAVRRYWIRVWNVHEKVAFEDIVRAIFARCVELRSKGAIPSTLGAHFRGTVEVAFATKEDAKDAIAWFCNRIQLFQLDWGIMPCRPAESPKAAFSSSLRISDSPDAPEIAVGGLANCKQSKTNGAVGVADSATVIISFIDERVPPEVVVPLFKTVGRVKSHKFLEDPEGFFNGTVELEYERSEDAHTAAKLFHGNIRFFGRTWQIKAHYFVEKEEDDNDEDDGDDNDEDNDDDTNDDDDDTNEDDTNNDDNDNDDDDGNINENDDDDGQGDNNENDKNDGDVEDEA